MKVAFKEIQVVDWIYVDADEAQWQSAQYNKPGFQFSADWLTTRNNPLSGGYQEN
jgi:hypothetical protein